MPTEHLTPWLTGGRAAWLDEATEWIADCLASLRLGDIRHVVSHRERPWSAVLRVTASGGAFFFKAAGLGGMHEPALLVDLERSWPELVPQLLAVDMDRAWMLMADSGMPIRDVATAEEQLATLEAMLPVYAEMQRGSAVSVSDLLATGMPDRRITRLPGLFEDLLGGETVGGEPLPAELRDAMLKLLPAFADACDQLNTSPFADALNHGDLHTGNVLVKDGVHRLIDWGDASVSHPFISLFVTFCLAVPWLEGIDKGAAARRLRDAYLHGWEDMSRESFDVALWVGHVERVLNWVHMLASSDASAMPGWHDGIVDLLERCAERYVMIDRPDELISALVERPVG